MVRFTDEHLTINLAELNFTISEINIAVKRIKIMLASPCIFLNFLIIYFHLKLYGEMDMWSSRSVCAILLSAGLAAASSAMAAPAQLETSVIGTGSHSTYGGVFDHLPQGIDYTLSTKFEYDTDSIEVDSGLTRVSGAMGFTVVAGDQTVSFNSGGIPSYGYLRSETLNNADGYNNALRFDHLFYLPGDSYYFEVSYTISWRDGTAAPDDFLTAPQNLLAGDDYHLTSSVVANWFDERAGNLYVNTREGNVTMTMVPEPSAAVMLLGGLAAGFLVRSRRRPGGSSAA